MFVAYLILFFRLSVNRTNEDIAVLLAEILRCNFDDLPNDYFLDKFRYIKNYTGSVEYNTCIDGERTQHTFIKCMEPIRDICASNKVECLQRLNETRACAAEPGCIQKRLITTPDDPFVKRQSCLDELQRTKILPCLTLLKRQCRNADIVVAKTIRLTMNQVEIMMKYDPFLKVIHLVRDPRAIMASRIQIHNKIRSTLAHEIDNLCRDMLRDIDRANYLHRIYPDRIMELPYELAAKGRILVLRQLYNYLNKKIKLQSITADTKDNGSYGTFRKNSLAIVDKWRSEFNKSEKAVMSAIPSCGTLVELMGYDM